MLRAAVTDTSCHPLLYLVTTTTYTLKIHNIKIMLNNDHDFVKQTTNLLIACKIILNNIQMGWLQTTR